MNRKSVDENAVFVIFRGALQLINIATDNCNKFRVRPINNNYKETTIK